MALPADGSSASLHPFVTGHVEPGATVVTDAWMGYYGLAGLGYVHQRRSQRAVRARGQDPGEPLPAVRRVASLAKRWLLSTHQGSVRRRICRATGMSSCSASTGAGREAAGWSSAGCSSSPPATTRCATATSSPAGGHGRSRRRRQPDAGIRQAWSGRQPSARGEPLTWTAPVKWRPQSGGYLKCPAKSASGQGVCGGDMSPPNGTCETRNIKTGSKKKIVAGHVGDITSGAAETQL